MHLNEKITIWKCQGSFNAFLILTITYLLLNRILNESLKTIARVSALRKSDYFGILSPYSEMYTLDPSDAYYEITVTIC